MPPRPRPRPGWRRPRRRRLPCRRSEGDGRHVVRTPCIWRANAGQAGAVLKGRCGDHSHRFDFSSERTFGLAGFRTLRILTRRHGEAADLRILIADWNQFGVLACLPFLHIVERFPSADDETIGSYNRPDHPISLHYIFAKAHAIVGRAKTDPSVVSAAFQEVEQLNFICSELLEDFTAIFVRRAQRFQLIEIPKDRTL